MQILNKKVIKGLLVSFLNRINKNDLKDNLLEFLPGIDIDDIIIKSVQIIFQTKKNINLGGFLGKADVYYKDGILIRFVGLLNIFLEKLIITEEKIIYLIYDVFEQFKRCYLSSESCIEKNVDDILEKISEIKIGNSVFTLYDFLEAAIANNNNNLKIKTLHFDSKSVDKREISKCFVEFITKILLDLFANASKSIHINYKEISNSLIFGYLFSKKTNGGQISKILKISDIDPSNMIKKTIKNYAGESFFDSFGELLLDVLANPKEKNNISKNNIFNLTMTFGVEANSRVLRWFDDYFLEDNHIRNNESMVFLEIAEDKNFSFSKRFRPSVEVVKLARSTLGFALKYKFEKRFKYTVRLDNLSFGKTYYYRISNKNYDYRNSFELNEETDENKRNFNFLVFADSQGMVKSDYEVFLNLLNNSVLKCDKYIDFLVHLGDFVDDGNNESYWDFVLNSKIWGQKAVIPVAGNHEAKFNPPINILGIKNSIINHFAISDMCKELEQDFSKGAYFSYTYKNTLFIVLNTNLENESGLGKQQYCWALKIAKSSDARWKIILTHKPAYLNSQHGHNKNTKRVSEDLIKLSSQCDIDLVLGGHDHIYFCSSLLCMKKKVSVGEEYFEEDWRIINSTINGRDNEGSVFLTCGASGVKNYKAPENMNVLNFSYPSYAQLEILDSEIKIKINKFENNSIVSVDKFIIKKANKNSEKTISIKDLEKMIDNIPDCPWMPWDEKINRVENELYRFDKKNIKNYDTFVKVKKNNDKYHGILRRNICMIYNKQEFLDAVSNPKIGTIIIKCNEIKFENIFGFGRNINIDHDLCIKGKSDLLFVSFKVNKGITLILDGKINIIANRKIFSIYPAISIFKMKKNSTLILGKLVSISRSFGLGRGLVFKFHKDQADIYYKF
ncbi:MAG: metallophosphoesterase [Candidatus Improbicoccus pseudotrichonymphae]|uniref:Metallophosphoesterase n=1 Tax=Candidatus Improbicoccus pseudotrichonymphae TaxID=3033792 RepID=A0AA48I8J3_9FIRM|nr:MAG: metallophosphoesterase [Candidatus Improbicoccus pseudotrichonymphae]